MTNRVQALVLHRTIRRPTPATLHSREIELHLTNDGRDVTLSRYVERYGDSETAWCCVRHHRVPVARLIRWMISNGIVADAFSEPAASETDTTGHQAQVPGIQ